MAGKCAAYWRAKDAGKDCGVPESRSSLKIQSMYREGVVLDLVSMGMSEDTVFELCKMSVLSGKGNRGTGHKPINYFALKRESSIRKKMLDFIFLKLSSNENISFSDLFNAGFHRDNWTDDDYMINYIPASRSLCVRGIALRNAAPKARSERGVNIAITKTLKNPVPHVLSKSSLGASSSMSEKNLYMGSLLTCGQMGILTKMVLGGYGDNEYAALCIALKWAAERLEAEKAAKEES